MQGIQKLKNSLLVIAVALGALGSVPLPALAVTCGNGTPKKFSEFLCLITDLANVAIPIVAGIALLGFFWGLAKFILHADNEDAREEGKQVMVWGIVAIFVLVSIWGIVYFFTNDLFGISAPGIPQLPI